MNTDSYCTPQSVLNPIRSFIGGRIDLDPCSNAFSLVNARQEFYEADNGLTKNWVDYDTIFVNPPYSKPNLALWSQKCMHESTMDRLGLFLLIPVSTATAWWHDNILSADAILFYKGRISFIAPGSTEKAHGNRHDSCLVYWGFHPDAFKEHFSTYGWIYTKK